MLTVAQMPQHYHTSMHWSSPDAARFGVNAGVGNTSAWYFGYAGGGAEANFVTGYAGSSQAHNHGFTGTTTMLNTISPYYAVYMWRRTA